MDIPKQSIIISALIKTALLSALPGFLWFLMEMITAPKGTLDARCGAVLMEKTTKQNVNAAVPLPNMDASLKPDLSGTSGYIQISPVVRKLIRKYISSEPQQNALTTVS